MKFETIVNNQDLQRFTARDRLTITCSYCEQDFGRGVRDLRKAQKRGDKHAFCSHACRWQYQSYEDVACGACSTKFRARKSEERKYCSQSCAARVNCRGGPLAPGYKHGLCIGDGRYQRSCRQCGGKFRTTHRDGHFCSQRCHQRHRHEAYIQRWLAGEEDGCVKGGGTSSRIRRYLFELHSSQCGQCGWGQTNPHTGTIPLELEHIDGDHTNNRPENLTLLCPNCHSLTATYKGANRGNGRAARRQRYAESKSC